MDFSCDPLTQLKHPEPESDSDSDSDSESDSEEIQNDFVSNEIADITELTEMNDLIVEEVKTIELERTVEEVRSQEPLEITLNQEESDSTYSKMSMKQLKELLSSKGIKPKNNIRKDELIDLITKEMPVENVSS
jgi:hypothetical protein